MTSTKLSALDRFQAVFQHDTSALDRLPLFYLDAPPVGLFYQEWVKDVANEDMDDRWFRMVPGFGDLTLRKWLGAENVFFQLYHLHQYPKIPLPRQHPLFDPRYVQTVDWNGAIRAVGQRMHGVDYSWYVGGFFNSMETRDEFYAIHGEPWDDRFAPTEAELKFFRKKLEAIRKTEDFAAFVGGGAIFHRVWDGIGTGSPFFAVMSRKYPKQFERWVRDHYKVVRRAWELQLETGLVDFMMLWDDTGQKGRPLLSPRVYERFFQPVLRDLCALAHKHGAKVLMHSCGYQEELLEHYIHAGLDALQSLEITAQNDLGRIRQTVGDRLILVGGIDASDVLSFGTPREVEEHVATQCKTGIFTRKNAMYIPGPTHDILDCPVENICCFRDSMLSNTRME